jgi:transposase
MVYMPTPEEFAALSQALADAIRCGEDARQRSEALAEQLRVTTGELRVTRTERDLLQEQLNRFKRQLFAARNEASAGHQKDMFFNEAESLGAQVAPVAEEADDGEIDVPGHKRAKRGRKPLDPALPREVVRHELPEGERVCPHDGAGLREIGVEVSEQLDIVPQQVRVIRHERVKYACPCCDGSIRLAVRPAQVIPKGLFTESALAWIGTSKYLDGLPLYRQAALLGRFGGTDISRNTLAASIVRVGEATQPVVNLLRDELLDAPLVFGDETELQVLKEPGRKAQAKSYIWAQMTDGSGKDGRGPPIRLFAYSPSRSTQTALQLYAGIGQGAVLMTDGYEVYDAVAEKHRLVHLACWTHCRRYFHEALQALPKDKRGADQLPARFIELIGKLYKVEAQARRDEVDAHELGRRRREHSVPVLAGIEGGRQDFCV